MTGWQAEGWHNGNGPDIPDRDRVLTKYAMRWGHTSVHGSHYPPPVPLPNPRPLAKPGLPPPSQDPNPPVQALLWSRRPQARLQLKVCRRMSHRRLLFQIKPGAWKLVPSSQSLPPSLISPLPLTRGFDKASAMVGDAENYVSR